MDKLQGTRRLHLFVLRVWLEEEENGKSEWRAEIEHIPTREKRYFREWDKLFDFVQSSCEQAQQGGRAAKLSAETAQDFAKTTPN